MLSTPPAANMQWRDEPGVTTVDPPVKKGERAVCTGVLGPWQF